MDNIKKIQKVRKFEWYDQLRAISHKIVNTLVFNIFVTFIICVSAVLIGAQTFNFPKFFDKLIHIADYAITVFFAFEIVARYLGCQSNHSFFKKGWNIFDLFIVCLSLIPITGMESVIIVRLLRTSRILRLISVIPELRFLVNSLLTALPRMAYIALLMFIIFYIYGAVGATIFKNINEFLWGDVIRAMLTLFRIATFEDWTDIMYETQTVYSLSWIYYLSFIFLTAFVFLNMMVGSIVDVMSSEQEHIRKSKLNVEERLQEPATMQQVADLNEKIDKLMQELKNKQ